MTNLSLSLTLSPDQVEAIDAVVENLAYTAATRAKEELVWLHR